MMDPMKLLKICSNTITIPHNTHASHTAEKRKLRHFAAAPSYPPTKEESPAFRDSRSFDKIWFLLRVGRRRKQQSTDEQHGAYSSSDASSQPREHNTTNVWQLGRIRGSKLLQDIQNRVVSRERKPTNKSNSTLSTLDVQEHCDDIDFFDEKEYTAEPPIFFDDETVIDTDTSVYGGDRTDHYPGEEQSQLRTRPRPQRQIPPQHGSKGFIKIHNDQLGNITKAATQYNDKKNSSKAVSTTKQDHRSQFQSQSPLPSQLQDHTASNWDDRTVTAGLYNHPPSVSVQQRRTKVCRFCFQPMHDKDTVEQQYPHVDPYFEIRLISTNFLEQRGTQKCVVLDDSDDCCCNCHIQSKKSSIDLKSEKGKNNAGAQAAGIVSLSSKFKTSRMKSNTDAYHFPQESITTAGVPNLETSKSGTSAKKAQTIDMTRSKPNEYAIMQTEHKKCGKPTIKITYRTRVSSKH